MQLLGTIINIYQKQIVQDQILEEIIAVKPLLIGCDQILDIGYRNLSDHIFLTGITAKKYIYRIFFIIDLQILTALKHLTSCRRGSELRNKFHIIVKPVRVLCYHNSFYINDRKIHLCNCL